MEFKKFRSSVWVTVLFGLWLVGCAKDRPGMEITAEVLLPRLDVAEIREAFKNGGQEKRVGLTQLGEAVCVYAQCGLQFESRGPVREPAEAGEQAKMNGYLVFSRKSASGLLRLMDEARSHGKEFSQRGSRGSVKCTAEECRLSFVMKRGAHITTENFFSHLKEDSEIR